LRESSMLLLSRTVTPNPSLKPDPLHPRVAAGPRNRDAWTVAEACGFPINLAKKESGLRSRANLTWHITADIMTYYTFSLGFRPGGFNRIESPPGQAPALVAVAYYCGGLEAASTCQHHLAAMSAGTSMPYASASRLVCVAR